MTSGVAPRVRLEPQPVALTPLAGTNKLHASGRVISLH